MSELIKKHPVLSILAIIVVVVIVGLVVAIHDKWLYGEKPITQLDVEMWKITATFFGSALALALVQVLLKLKEK